ncbi:relaxase/mobilization nuclease domain-containing protein [Acidocella sp. KAb 2-4]|uniref:relaxase/mobilization nuclease domain-containing protein n=1 Tax=Acidocella sp. KAb 2-4 TaxID=2885158 RepID=UPI001D070084|nr:relaxase/mobilization nuclease domain-containing protein [Acidocella sp. KAb 2-4]
MIPVIISNNSGRGKRATGGAVFKRVTEYIEKERAERGPTMTADCVLDSRSAAVEMEAVAHGAPRCKDPALHIVLSWQQGEHPTEQQQREAVATVLDNLRDKDGRDMSGHQWVATLHRETDNDHLHILINRVDPETMRTVSPEWSERSLHKAAREIEAAQGWKEDSGLMKWDAQQRRAVKTPQVEREQQKSDRLPEKAARMEAHSYSESLTGYVKSSGVEKELRQILKDERATWADVQYSLGRHGLEIRKAEKGGYTITDGEQHTKASDALRGVFSGKENRARLDRLGDWSVGVRDVAEQTYSPQREPQYEQRTANKEAQAQAAGAEKQQAEKPAPSRRDDPAATAERERRAEERKQAREALWGRYQETKREWAKTHPGPSKEAISRGYAQIRADLKGEREWIRATTKKGSEARAVAQSVAAFRAIERRDQFRESITQQRAAVRPPEWRTWVEQQANQGDKAAQAQMKGWHYTQQRTSEPVRQKLEATDRQAPARNEGVTHGVEWRRRWFLGGTEYKIDGKAAVIDKGDKIKLVGARKADDRAVALAIGLQAEKRGGNVRVDGSRAFKERVADIAADRGIYAKFEDRQMQARYEQRKAEQRQAIRPDKGQKQAQTPEARRPTAQAVVAREREQQKQQQQQKQKRGVSRLWRG